MEIKKSRNSRKTKLGDKTKTYKRKNRSQTPHSSKKKFPKTVQKNRDYFSKGSEKFYSTIKEKLFEILGGKRCTSCGFKDERALGFTLFDDPEVFDPIKRGGFVSSWGKYISEPELARKKIRVLCLNCNAIREPIKTKQERTAQKRSKFFPRKQILKTSYDN